MRRLTTLLCSVAFLMAGILLSQIDTVQQNTVTAAPPLVLMPPLDLQLGNRVTEDSIKILRDTITLRDTVQVVKYKYRTKKKLVEPDTIVKIQKDTLYVPALYVVIQQDSALDNDTIVRAIRDVE